MTRSNAAFHGYTISHKVEQVGIPKKVDLGPDYQIQSHDKIWIEANHPTDGTVGEMYLTGYGVGGRTVGHVSVEPEHQRKGIATAMWNYAKQNGFNPLHSPQRTPEGEAWAKSTGDETPKFYKNFD